MTRTTYPMRRRLSLRFELPYQVLRFFLDLHVGVADDPEQSLAEHLTAGEKLV